MCRRRVRRAGGGVGRSRLCSGPWAATICRDMGRVGYPRSPRPVGLGPHTDSRAPRYRRPVGRWRLDPDAGAGREKVESIVVGPKSEHRAQLSRSTCQIGVRSAFRAPCTREVHALDHLTRSQQDSPTNSLGTASDVAAQMDSIAAVDIEMARRTEHRGIAWRRTRIAVRGRIGPRSGGIPAIRLDLDDPHGHASTRLVECSHGRAE